MKTYHFDLGNSNTGCVGLCARVTAKSKRDAVRQLQNAFEQCDFVTAEVEYDGSLHITIALKLLDWPDVEYFHVYLNLANLSSRHIDVVEEID